MSGDAGKTIFKRTTKETFRDTDSGKTMVVASARLFTCFKGFFSPTKIEGLQGLSLAGSDIELDADADYRTIWGYDILTQNRRVYAVASISGIYNPWAWRITIWNTKGEYLGYIFCGTPNSPAFGNIASFNIDKASGMVYHVNTAYTYSSYLHKRSPDGVTLYWSTPSPIVPIYGSIWPIELSTDGSHIAISRHIYLTSDGSVRNFSDIPSGSFSCFDSMNNLYFAGANWIEKWNIDKNRIYGPVVIPLPPLDYPIWSIKAMTCDNVNVYITVKGQEYYTGDIYSYMIAIRARDGAHVWTSVCDTMGLIVLGSASIGTIQMDYHGYLYTASNAYDRLANPTVYKVNPLTGAVEWAKVMAETIQYNGVATERNIIVPSWITGSTGGACIQYFIGDIVQNNGIYYECIRDHSSCPWNPHEPGVSPGWGDYWVEKT